MQSRLVLGATASYPAPEQRTARRAPRLAHWSSSGPPFHFAIRASRSSSPTAASPLHDGGHLFIGQTRNRDHHGCLASAAAAAVGKHVAPLPLLFHERLPDHLPIDGATGRARH